MERINLKFMSLISTAIVLALGCSDNSNSDTPTPTPTPGAAYLYKAMVVGSTGHMTITVTPGDTAKSEVMLNMDGEDHELNPVDDAILKLGDGDAVSNVEFSSGDGHTATVSAGSNGENPTIDLSVTGHEDAIVVEAFQDSGDADVSVYEGESTTWFASATSDEDEVATKSVYNLMIKGNKFKLMSKQSSVGEKSCVTAEELDKKINQFGGSYALNGNKATFTFDGNGGEIEVHATMTGDEIVGDLIESGDGDEETSCMKTRVPNADRAYALNDSGSIGYNISDADGGGQIECAPAENEGDPGLCIIEGKEGKRLLDENGALIPLNSTEYYIDGETQSATKYQFRAKKVL